MTTHVVADDVLGKTARKQWELQRRLMEGSLDPFLVSIALQQLIEGKFLFDDLFAHFKQFLLPLDKQLEKIRFHNENTWNRVIPEEFIDQVDTSSTHEQFVTDLEVLHVEGHNPGQTVSLLWMAIVAETPELGHRMKIEPKEQDSLKLHSPELLPSNYIRPSIKRVRLNLVANWSRKIKAGISTHEVRAQAYPCSEEILAHGEVLSALAWNPGLFSRMDGKTFPFMDLAGYDIKARGAIHIPYIWVYKRTGEIELGYWHGKENDPSFSAPVILSPVPKEFEDSEPDEA